METRAHYLVVGIFVVVLAFGGVAAAIWLTKVSFDARYDNYLLVFDGSVGGLSENSAVNYNGVRVGQVMDVRLDPQDPSRVRVQIRVNADTPVKTDTVAMLNLEGLTGGKSVLLSGGSPSAAPLTAAGKGLAQIPTRPSAVDRLLSGAPDLLAAANRLVGRLEAVLSDQNVAALSNLMQDGARTMASVNEASMVLADLARDLRTEVGTVSQQTTAALEAVQKLAAGSDAVVQQKLPQALDDMEAAASSAKRLTDTLTAVVQENRASLRQFTGGGLEEFARALSDLRSLIVSLNAATQEIQRDPARFLFGNAQSGYVPGQDGRNDGR